MRFSGDEWLRVALALQYLLRHETIVSLWSPRTLAEREVAVNLQHHRTRHDLCSALVSTYAATHGVYLYTFGVPRCSAEGCVFIGLASTALTG